MKPIPIMEAALARRLQSRPDLRTLGILAERSNGGGVVLSKDGLYLGTWHWRPTAFAFELVDAERLLIAQTIMGAAAITSSILSNDG